MNGLRMSRHVVFALLCHSLIALPGATWANGWTKHAEIPDQEGNLTLIAPWHAERGATFRFTSADGARAATVRIERAGGHATATGSGSDGAPLRARSFAAAPARSLAQAEWTWTFRRRHWTLYLKNRPVFACEAPFALPAALKQPSAELAAEAGRRPRFQRTSPFTFHDNFFLPGDTRDPLAEWEQVSGEWALRTAADTAAERGEEGRPGRRPRRAPDPERSANFSRVSGRGEPAVLLTGHEFYNRYVLEAALEPAPGEAGLVFLHTDQGACHALTLTRHADAPEALLRLWRVGPGPDTARQTMAAATTELTDGQWVKLKVVLHDNRILAFLDNTLLADLAAELPAGGRFGLYAHAADGALFDDVRARSNLDVPLDEPEDIRWHTLARRGSFETAEPPAGNQRRGAVRAAPAAPAEKDQWLVFGEPDHAGQVFSAEFHPEPDDGRIGLVLGYRNEAAPAWRFVRSVEQNEEVLRLESAQAGANRAVEELRLPLDGQPLSDPVTLMADMTAPGLWRLYRNGTLVLAHHHDGERRGAAGVWIGARTAATVGRLGYRFAREGLHHDQFEKNRAFREDPFMRNWASPEGEWAQDERGLTWHKGDFYGRFLCRMPYVEGTEIHLGVPDGAATGEWIVSASERNIRLESVSETGRRTVVASASADSLAKQVCEQTEWATPYFDIHYEGHALWIASGSAVPVRHSLVRPLAGRRLRIEGFGLADLAHSFVKRHQVKDFLFTESPHEWVRNGGEWAVINRFQCDPRWSHMNGESASGLAALWSKYDFSGDFCLEMYAGMRHGFYERAGDLNLTAMSEPASPGRGYTVTCTGWDRDHSQLHTRLYRDGRLLAETDETLVPRRREGQRRRIRDPLVRAGRDMHGAWYYLKLRRIGDRIEYYFDNELIFSETDPDPVGSGTFGIWTFMNSMMVARVKMAAEHMAPRPHRLRHVALETAIEDLVPPLAYHALERRGVLARNWRPSESLLPNQWRADDPTGQTRLSWRAERGDAPAFVATTLLGAGEMFARAELPPDLYDELVGWTFEVKRTAGARFNFHFSLGTMDATGVFHPSIHGYHRLSGDDFCGGEHKKIGSTDVPGHAPPGERWMDATDWTPVTVWLPDAAALGWSGSDRLWVRVEGFGNRKPSLTLQGLAGNAPGEAYAIRRFTDIRNHPPRLDGTLPGATVEVTNLAADPPLALGECASLHELSALIGAMDAFGHTRLRLTHRAPDADWTHDWHWLRLPPAADLALQADWHPDIPDAIRVEQTDAWHDRRFSAATLRIGEETVSTWHEETGRLAAFVPRVESLTRTATPVVPVEAQLGGAVVPFTLSWSDALREGAPVLFGLGKENPYFLSFENREPVRDIRQNEAPARLKHLHPQQGTFLRVANDGKLQRLRRTLLSRPATLSRYPLVQFRYRASAMAHISMEIGWPHSAVRLGEDHRFVVPVRGTGDIVMDDTWRTWYGIVSDAMGSMPLAQGMMNARSLVFGSHTFVEDQTGLFATWDVDDIVRGPVVSEHRPLILRPEYFSFHSVEKVLFALAQGETPAAERSPEDLAQLDWQESANREPVRPDTSRLPEGIHRVFLQARSGTGMDSAVTDIPFLVNNVPPVVSHRFIEPVEAIQNGPVLEIEFRNETGVPLEFDRLAMKWNDEPIPGHYYGDWTRVFHRKDRRHPALPPNSRPSHAARTMGTWYRHGRESSRIQINWAFLLQDRLASLEDGSAFTLSLSGLRTGAGHEIGDIVVPMRLDYRQDTSPPTLLSTQYPNNVYWRTNWDPLETPGTFFGSNQPCQVAQDPHLPPHLEHTTETDTGVFFAHLRGQGGWRIARHPYFAFQLRVPDEPADRVRMFVSFRRNPDRDFIRIPLNGPDGPAIYRDEPGVTAPLPEPAVWQAGVWQSFVLDMREILADKIPEEEFETKPLYLMIFSTENDSGQPMRVHMRNGFIFSAWGPEDSMTFHAYDASGMDGFVWQADGRSVRAPTLAPAAEFAGAGLNRWMKVQALDRAGNASYPLHVPLGPIGQQQP